MVTRKRTILQARKKSESIQAI